MSESQLLVRFGGTPKKIHYSRGTFAVCTLDRPMKERTLVRSSRVSATVEPGQDELEVARKLASQLVEAGLEPLFCRACRDVWEAK